MKSPIWFGKNKSTLISGVLSALMFGIGYWIGVINRPSIGLHCSPTPSSLQILRSKLSSSNQSTNSFQSPCAKEEDNVNDMCSSMLGPMSMNLVLTKRETTAESNILAEVFSAIHHPDTPVDAEIYISQSLPAPKTQSLSDCESIFLTRTGSKTEMSVKCVAVAQVASSHIGDSVLSHRMGTSAKLLNQYQQDYAIAENRQEEEELLPLMLHNLHKVTRQFREMLGDPIDPTTNSVRTAILMVANEGVMDLLLNFICSCKEAGIDLRNFIVVVGQPDYISLIEDMGGHALFSKAFGPIPKSAAANYGDHVFSRLMWLKATSMYVAAAAGFNVLFQDTDLVWLKDPIPYLEAQPADVVFMDDGARTPRFAPLFVNSGFYYQKNNPRTAYLMERMLKSICEISSTHSHQATLTRHITEAHHIANLQIAVLSMDMFPSGIMYHHNKQYVKQVIQYDVKPFVWHMCWTSSREDKVRFFKEMGMWYIEDARQECTDATFMKAYVAEHNQIAGGTEQTSRRSVISQICCADSHYWRGYPRA